jgi:serine kinase of HPr protein (carbohydrate metabolism regulator)
MNVRKVVQELGLDVLAGEDHLDREVQGGYVADLLSCVIAGAEAGELWITLQSHGNIVAVTSLKELAGVVIAEGAAVPPETVERAEQQGVVVLSSSEPIYETVKHLVALGL